MAKGDRERSPVGHLLLHVVEEWWPEAGAGWRPDGDSRQRRIDDDYGWFATGGTYAEWQEAEHRWAELVAQSGDPGRYRIISTSDARLPAHRRDDGQRPATSSIYDRIGGKPAIRRVVKEFYQRMTTDPVFAARFRYVDLGRLMGHQVAVFTLLTGGPNETNRDTEQIHGWLQRVHGHLRLTSGEFDRMAGHLVSTLQGAGVVETDVQTLARGLESFRGDIVSY